MTALNRFLVRYVRRGNKTSATESLGIGGGTGPDRSRKWNRSAVMFNDLSNERTNEANEFSCENNKDRRVAETIGAIPRCTTRAACMTRYIAGDLCRGGVDSRNAIHAIRAIRQIGRIIYYLKYGASSRVPK